jgi:hypothetical protein
MNDWAHPKAGFASEMNDNGMECCHVHFWPPQQKNPSKPIIHFQCQLWFQ